MCCGYSHALLVLVWSLAAGVLLWGSGVDIELQRRLWVNYHQGFNDVMRLLGEIGKGTALLGVCVALAAARLGWRGMRGSQWRPERGVGLILAAVPVVALAGAANLLVKVAVGRPRPKEFLMNGGEPWGVRPFGHDAVFWSFPSGHSCSVFAAAVWLACAFPRGRAVFLPAAALLAASRFLAVTPHYLGDVVAGAGLGAAVALAAWQWSKERRYV
jgi:membrane-associated phospholipid phosphatase